jgi:hypothetical protein
MENVWRWYRLVGVRLPDWWCWPTECPRGYEWGPGLVLVGWKSCSCAPVLEAGGPAGTRWCTAGLRAAGRGGTGRGTSGQVRAREQGLLSPAACKATPLGIWGWVIPEDIFTDLEATFRRVYGPPVHEGMRDLPTHKDVYLK